jgi:hypothetical protein
VSGVRRCAAALLAALAGCLALAAPAGAARSASLPAAFLVSVSCPSQDACWAVGLTTGGRAHPVIDRWNGSTWDSVPVLVPRTALGLWAVSCASVAFCWAVGTYGPNKEHPFAEHWNGTKWSLVPLPAFPGPSLAVSDDVWCSSKTSCWALEDQGPAEFEHWDGRAWTVMTVPAFGRNDRFDRVTCASDRDCWVTGTHGTAGTISGHWDGTTWSAVPTPTRHARGDSLGDISCPGVSCLAVGSTDEPYRPLAERWNGSAWRVTPIAVPNALLAGVSCATTRYCLAVGLHTNSGGRAISERWTGSRWRAAPVPAPPRSSNALLVAVDCITRTDCWAVGSDMHGQAEPSLFEHWNGTAWSIAS